MVLMKSIAPSCGAEGIREGASSSTSSIRVETLKYRISPMYRRGPAEPRGRFEMRRMCKFETHIYAIELKRGYPNSCDSGDGWEGGVNSPIP
jgi:hypothetical protein